MSKKVYTPDGRLPKYVTCFYDRHGKARFRFRKGGHPVHYFKNQPGSDEFAQELTLCMKARSFQRKISDGLRRDPISHHASKANYWHSDRRIYFIGSEAGPIKIGVADCAKSRLETLQTGSPVKLFIMAEMSGGPNIERSYHEKFSEHRLHGEWFAPHPDILAEIDRLKQTTGYPFTPPPSSPA